MVKKIISVFLALLLTLPIIMSADIDVMADVEYFEDFSSISAWTQNSASISTSNGIASITENNPDANYGYISHSVTINLTEHPYIQINIPYLGFGGMWALKVNDGGSDIDIWNNYSRVGVLTKNLASITGWSGTKTFTLKLFAINEGQTFKVDWVKIITNPMLITYPDAGSIVNSGNITVEGASIPGTSTQVFIDGTSSGTVSTDSDGIFVKSGIAISEASHTIYAVSGSNASPSSSVTYDKETVFYYAPPKANPFNPDQPDFQRVSYDERLTLGSIQGIVNKQSPRFFIENHVDTSYWAGDTLWRKYYTGKKGYTFVRLETLEDVMRKFRYDVAGITLYDNNRDASKAIAMTYAGLNNYVAIREALLTGEFKRIALQQDLRGRWTSDAAAYDWAQTNLLPYTNHKGVYSMGRNHDGIFVNNDPIAWVGFDYGVQQQMFFFNLSPDASKYPGDASRFTTIVESMEEPGECWGWAEPEWDVFNSRVSWTGNYIMLDGSNCSFHAKVPCNLTSFTQNTHKTTANTTLENKYYVVFQQTEGDTMKAPLGMYFGDWVSPRRGQIKRNFGINPVISAKFPAVMEYYYSDTANKYSANDYFYAGGGLGYVLLDEMAESTGGASKVSSYASTAANWMSNSDLKVMDMWMDNEVDEPSMNTFMSTTGLYGSTCTPLGLDNTGKMMYTLSEQPIIVPAKNLHYWQAASPAELRDKIVAVANQHAKPFVIQVFGAGSYSGANFVEVFDSSTNWTQTTATISTDSNGIATIRENNPTAPYGFVKRSVTMNLDTHMMITAKVHSVDNGGAYAIKVNDGQSEYTIVSDSTSTGEVSHGQHTKSHRLERHKNL